ncbi:unnamed protein product [Dracunculus medinensis]|uniref:Mitochondrial import receptor subunit TOM40 n=1 Tax=Dracunculus medinensis TaxID=318479 RepID=A0A0N4UNV5_DRAME|nr:unnamed protein product [Dracunculus medinensis]
MSAEDLSIKNSPIVPNIIPAATTSTNPGSFDELHRKCRDVFPAFFEGAKAMLQKPLSSHFSVSHTINISSPISSYRIGATYVGAKQTATGEVFPVLLGDTDLDGNTSATFIHQFGEKWRMKLQSQMHGGSLNATQGTFEYRGRLSTLGLTCANIDILNESGIAVGHYLRRMTPRLDLGAELVYQYGKQVPGGQATILSYGGRYTTDKYTASAVIGNGGLHLCYYHKQVENLAFGVEFESNFRAQEAVATFAYQAEIPEEGITMRASIDTNWNVGGVLEKRLSRNLPFTLALSGLINHTKAQGKFGIGLIIGS